MARSVRAIGLMPTPRAVGPAAMAAAIVLLAALLYACGYREQYYALAEIWGAAPFRTPFLDMQGVTSPVECHRLGYDVYVQNPCDVFNRPHNYSPLWLWLAVLPITTAWDDALALALVGLFLVALAFLPPGRDWRLITLATISSTTMFAMERANIDLLMFVMAMLVVRLRFTGYAIALLAGMLKFYPIVLLLAAVRERALVCLAVWTMALGVVALWFALDGTEILRAIANIGSNPPFDDNVFGAHNLPFGIAAVVGLPRSGAMALEVLLLAAMVGVAIGSAGRVRTDVLTEAEAVHLLVGAALLVSCFVIAQNVSYRAIYFLFVLPALIVSWRGAAWVAVLLMWNSGLRLAINRVAAWFGISTAPDGMLHFAIWLLRELAWWAVITLLAALLLRLVWESQAVRQAVTWGGQHERWRRRAADRDHREGSAGVRWRGIRRGRTL
ncbi:MAG: hypothetical protein WAL10_10385 [Acetobacteraceae bacterium]|jgi:hypothetical protein